METNFIRLQKEVHNTASSKGWWDGYGNDDQNAYFAFIANLHDEITEATEASIKRDENNFKEELADLIIRIFDFCQFFKFDLYKNLNSFIKTTKPIPGKNIRVLQKRVCLYVQDYYADTDTIEEALLTLHVSVSHVFRGYAKRKNQTFWNALTILTARILCFAESWRIDLAKEINKKNEYNKTRDYRHGNKRC